MKKSMTCKIKVLEKRADGGKIIITTPDFDRAQDRIASIGGDLGNYNANPIVLWGHDYNTASAVIGRSNTLEVSDAGIVADFTLRPAVNVFDPQNIVLQLWNQGYIHTASVGFLPKDGKKNERGGMDYSTWELLEWSLVPVPANPQAIRQALTKALEGQTEKGAWDLLLPVATEMAGVAQRLSDSCAAVRDGLTTMTDYRDLYDMLEGLDGMTESARNYLYMLYQLMYMGRNDPMPAGDVVDMALRGAAVLKAGRVLSAKNEGKLRNAFKLIEEVLSAVEADGEKDDKQAETEVTAETKGGGQDEVNKQAAEKAARELAQAKTEEQLAEALEKFADAISIKYGG